MILYIEYILLDNFVIDYMLLKLVGFTFKRRLKKFNLIFSTLVGVVSAVFLPFLLSYGFLMIMYKILTALLMVSLLQKYKSFKDYFKNLSVFILYTFLFGGVLIGVLNICQIKYNMSGILVYNNELPVGLFIIILSSTYWLLKKMIKTLNIQFRRNNYLHEIEIVDGKNKVTGIGFYDSGNNVRRDSSGVSIISIDLFLSLHKNYSFEKVLFRNIDYNILKKPKYINIKSLSKSSEYLSFVVDKLIVDRKEISNAVIAVAIKNFKDFDCIINSEIMGCVK